jgi:hypothetical protein
VTGENKSGVEDERDVDFSELEIGAQEGVGQEEAGQVTSDLPTEEDNLIVRSLS